MRRQLVAATFGVVVGILAAAPAAAQETQGEFRGETTVNVVEVPVRVVDPSTGEPVRGLGVADFRVLESGVEQRITNFAEIARSAPLPTAPPAPGETAAPGAAVTTTVTTEVRPLEMIYFFDLYLALKADKLRAVRALREQYRSQVPVDEEVSLVVYDGELEVLLDRSDDNFDVLDALDEIEAMDARGIQHFITFTDQFIAEGEPSGVRDQEFFERRQRNREYMVELEKRVSRVGNALSATMARYAIADARRVVVAFTPGFPGTNWSPTYTPVDFVNNAAPYPHQNLWHDLAVEASDLGFTLFMVDSSGLRASSALDAEVGVTDEISEMIEGGEIFGRGRQQNLREDPVVEDEDYARNDPNARTTNLGGWIERTRKNLLVEAATTTGGAAIFDEDVAQAMTEVASELDHYYSLAYTAAHSGDGEEYEISVEIPGRPELRLTHRSAYLDQSSSTRGAQRLRSAMLFGGDANPLGVRVELGDADSRFRLGAAGSKRVQVPFKIMIPYARIDMIPRGDQHWGKVLITFFAEDDAGNQSQLASLEQPITVESSRYEEAVAKGFFAYKTTIEIEGGDQKVYVGIQDLVSGRTSIMPQHFDF